MDNADASQPVERRGRDCTQRNLVDWSNLKADYRRLKTYSAVATEYGVSKSLVAREARRQKLTNGYSSVNSPLEKLLQDALRQVGISFETQKRVAGRFNVDILITQAKVVIEADGYWHTLKPEQDAERDSVIRAAGFRIFHFVGAQINRGADKCIQQVIEACGLVPDKDPEWVIRTGMIGPENPWWSGGSQSLICSQCGSETPPRFNKSYREGPGKKFCSSKCYGAWMSDHPEESPRRLKIDWNELPVLYRSGISLHDLQEKYGVGRTTIHRKLKEMNVEPRRARPGTANASRVYRFSEEARANMKKAQLKLSKSDSANKHGPDGRFVRKHETRLKTQSELYGDMQNQAETT